MPNVIVRNGGSATRVVGAAVTSLAAIMAACAPVRDQVPVAGPPGALELLVGVWSGVYEGTDSGRSGTLTFELEAGSDTAHGHVLMVPGRKDVPYARQGAGLDEPRPERPSPQPIGIRFVRLENDTLEGVLEPYEDPACGCPATTTFLGRIEGNVITGTFETVHGGNAPTERGTWRARKGR
jgi:hypothetical protein